MLRITRSTCSAGVIAVCWTIFLCGTMACNEEVAGDLADCTLADNGDGTVTITCQDGTSYTVFDNVDCTIVNRDDGTQDVICGGDDSGGGASGSLCTVVSNGDGTSTIRCNDGTEVIINGEPEEDGCTIVDNDDGTMTITCDDGTEVTVSDEPTEDTDTSCTIVENDDGTITITCDDGTEVTVAGNPDDYACTITDGEGHVIIDCGDQGRYTFYDDEAIVGDIVGTATLFGLDDHTGITVTLAGTVYSTTTDSAGVFALTNVPLGVYQLSFQYPDYTSQAVTNVAALPGNFQLDPVTLRVGRLIRAGINRMPLALSPDEDGILILEHVSTETEGRLDLPSTTIGIGSEYHESEETFEIASYRSERYYETGSFGSYSIGKFDSSLNGDLVLYRRSTDSVEELAMRVDGASAMFTPDGDVMFTHDLTKTATDQLTIYDTVANTSEVLADQVSRFWVSPDPLGNAVIYVALSGDGVYDVVLFNRTTELSETLFAAVSSDETNVHFNADGTFALIQADLDPDGSAGLLHLIELTLGEMVLVDEAVDYESVNFSVAGDMFAYVAYEGVLESNALHRYDANLVMVPGWVEADPPLFVHEKVPTGFVYGTGALVFHLSYTSDVGTTADLFVIPDTLTAPATPVTIESDTNDPGKYGMGSLFSPDRSSFMFLHYEGEVTGAGQLNVYDLATSTAAALSENVSLNSAVIGDRALVYIENVGLETEELVVWDTARVTDNKANLGDAAGFSVLFAPDGVSFVYLESGLEEEEVDLNFWDIVGWAESFVADIPLGGLLAPAFTGDGDWVLYFSTENRLDFDLNGWEKATSESLPLDDSLTRYVLVGEHFVVYTVLETEWPGLMRNGVYLAELP